MEVIIVVTLILDLSMAGGVISPSCSKKVLNVEDMLEMWKLLDSRTLYRTIIRIIHVSERFHYLDT